MGTTGLETRYNLNDGSSSFCDRRVSNMKLEASLNQPKINAVHRNNSDRMMEYFNPKPGYVIECFQHSNPMQKAFINICSNDKVPVATSEMSPEKEGLEWSVPSVLLSPQEDVDGMGRICIVYDAIFHHAAIKQCKNDCRFKKVLENAIFDALESRFKCKFVRQKLCYPKMKYKGIPRENVFRTKYDNDRDLPAFRYKLTTFIPSALQPNYVIKHRSEVSLKDFNTIPEHSSNLKPKELVVVVDLPLIDKTSDVQLDIEDDKLLLNSLNGTYKLDIKLPYSVNDENGKAELNKDTRKLTIVLPVCDQRTLTDVENEMKNNKADVDRIPSESNEEKVNELKTEAESAQSNLTDDSTGTFNENMETNKKIIMTSHSLDNAETNPKSANGLKKEMKSRKARSMSESATDDLKVHKPRGILKFPRNPLSRTMSESSDEVYQSSNDSDLHKSQSSPDIPEEGYSTEDTDKPKKTVRFEDKVSENLFRSNSSILGQRKKNQRKSKNKKKNARKRHDSENSSCSEAESLHETSNDKVPLVTKPFICTEIELSKSEDDFPSMDEGKWIEKKSKKGKKNRKTDDNLYTKNEDSGVELSVNNDEYEVTNLTVCHGQGVMC